MSRNNREGPVSALHLAGRADYNFTNVCRIFQGQKRPFRLLWGFYRIGEKSEVERYFDKYYVSQYWEIMTHDKFKGRDSFKVKSSSKLISETKRWREKFIAHYSAYFVSPQGFLYLCSIYEAGKQKRQPAKVESLFGELKLKEKDIEYLAAIAPRTLYYWLEKIAGREKTGWSCGPDRVTFWGGRRKPIFHLEKTIAVLKQEHPGETVGEEKPDNPSDVENLPEDEEI